MLLAFAGAAAGITSVGSCFPMDVVRTRLLVTGDGYTGGSGVHIPAIQKERWARSVGFLPAIIGGSRRAGVLHRVRSAEDEAAEAAGGGGGGGA